MAAEPSSPKPAGGRGGVGDAGQTLLMLLEIISSIGSYSVINLTTTTLCVVQCLGSQRRRGDRRHWPFQLGAGTRVECAPPTGRAWGKAWLLAGTAAAPEQWGGGGGGGHHSPRPYRFPWRRGHAPCLARVPISSREASFEMLGNHLGPEPFHKTGGGGAVRF